MQNPGTFLALTSDNRFWNTEGDVLFLGEWCLDEIHDSSAISFPYVVLPTPWNRERKLDDIALYLDKFSEKILWHLAEKLNKIHKVEYDLRCWRILAGNWIFHAVQAVYDRYLLLKNAVIYSDDLWTRLPLPGDFVFRTTNGCKEAQLYPDTSLIIFSILVRQLGIKCESIERTKLRIGESRYRNISPTKKFPALLRKILGLSQWIVAWVTAQQILFLATGVKNNVARRLGATSVQTGACKLPRLVQPDTQQREAIFAELSACDEFQTAAIAALPHLLPTSLLEEFHFWKIRANIYPISPTVSTAVTSYGFAGDEVHAHLLVRLIQSGCRLVGMQHGGGYGTFRHCPEELHEIRCSDDYVTWGWKNDISQYCHHSLPSLHLLNYKEIPDQGLSESERSGILFVTTARPGLTHRIQSHPLTGQLGKYYSWQERFFSGLSEPAKSDFVLKPYEADYAISEAVWSKKRDLRKVRGPLSKIMRNYQVLVFDHNGTGFLETLSANIPTLVYWDPSLWELRDIAIPLFQCLEDVGIFHRSPESAAEQMNRIHGHVKVWWHAANLQAARLDFCNSFARTSPNWENAWRQFLNHSVPSATNGHRRCDQNEQ